MKVNITRLSHQPWLRVDPWHATDQSTLQAQHDTGRPGLNHPCLNKRMAEPLAASSPFDDGERNARPGSPTRRETTSSVASFAFIPPTLPSYLSRSISHADDSEQQHHRLGLAEAIALVIGMQVGSGIFSSPGVIVHSTKSVGSSLIVWLVSGLLAWTGASSFAELGSAIPLNGGAQAYLAYAVSSLDSRSCRD